MAEKLTAEQVERLAMLAEEAGEVVQAVGKVLRHGYSSTHPDGGPTNRAALCREVGDLFGIVSEMCAQGDLESLAIEIAGSAKWAKALRYTHHQAGSPGRSVLTQTQDTHEE